MQFKKIYFYYDRNGVYLGDKEPQKLLTADQCNCKHFTLQDAEVRGYRGVFPVVYIERSGVVIDCDMYNCDGRPPRTMFGIAIPYIQHFSEVVCIDGLEVPNLCWAGHLRMPYNDEFTNPLNLSFLNANESDAIHSITFENRTRQRIMLTL